MSSELPIDYEALAKIAWKIRWGIAEHLDGSTDRDWERCKETGYDQHFGDIARAVVAAYEQQLRDQGMVVVQNRDILTMYQAVGVGIFLLDAERVAIDRLRSSAEPALPRLHNDAALAAPGEGE
jgi:hypothetical protein